jgi:hypothetical protein
MFELIEEPGVSAERHCRCPIDSRTGILAVQIDHLAFRIAASAPSGPFLDRDPNAGDFDHIFPRDKWRASIHTWHLSRPRSSSPGLSLFECLRRPLTAISARENLPDSPYNVLSGAWPAISQARFQTVLDVVWLAHL